MADSKAGAGAALIPGPPPGAPLPNSPLVGTSSAGVGVKGESNTSVGVLGNSIGLLGAGPPSDGVLGVGQNGVHGQSGIPGGSGVLGEHVASGAGVTGTSVSGIGVSGTSHGASPGVYGLSTGLDGVQGVSQSAQHAGVSGSNNSGGYGVWASSTGGEGVLGSGKNGVHGRSSSPTDSGVWGENTGSGYGVSGSSSGGVGVYGSSSLLDGVQGISAAKNHAGVSGTNNSGGDDGMGVYGYSTGSDGVRGISATQAHAGVSGSNTSGGIGVWGASSGEAGHFEGNVTINGMLAHNGDGHCSGTFTVANDIVLLGLGQDCAEQFEVSEAKQLEPGTVVVIDLEGALRESYAAYDKKVAGVVSGAGACRPGIILGKRASEAQSAHVALVGRVYCKVDAHYSPIEVGDLLTTSPTPGYAMRAGDPQKAFGAVIGKSLQRFDAGQGLIPILVALQ